mgnify:CR=1 FL=1
MAINVLIVEDHTIVRDGLERILNSESDINVIGTADDGIKAIKKFKKLNPDVILMDIMMPNMNGIQATGEIKEIDSSVEIIILSMNYSHEDITMALKAGARGYITKESVSDEVVEAVRAVNGGQRYLSADVDEILIDNFIFGEEKESEATPLESLSSREREVLQLVAEGKSSKEIAKMLYISTKTVFSYRSRLMKKLEIDNVADLIKFAIKHDITSL